MKLRKTLPTVALASTLLAGGLGLSQTANAQQINLSFGSDDYGYDSGGYYRESNLAGDVLGAFLSGVVNHFGRSQQDVYLLQDRGIRENELPVVFYLARQSGVSPMAIAQLRASGYSWSDITYRLGLTSDTYYVPLSGYYGQYASYYQMPRSRWSSLRLSDDAVIGLVNTRFLSDYYRMPADRVLRLRSSGRDFTTLARELYRPERQGRLQVWNRRTAATVQPRVDAQQGQVMTQRQASNRQAAQAREVRQQRELRQQEQVMTQRQASNRQAAQAREARQQAQEPRQGKAQPRNGRRNRQGKG